MSDGMNRLTQEQRVGRAPTAAPRARVVVELVAGFTLLLVAIEAVLWLFDAPAQLRLSAGGLYLALAIVVLGTGETVPIRLGWANRITLLRAALVLLIAGLAAFPNVLRAHPYAFLVLSLIALALDGVDGWVARRTDTITAFGARFDMELDAFFILVLCGVLVAIDKVGMWVLWIGMARYLFVLAAWVVPWMRRRLPASGFRKTVCVWQIVTLLVSFLPFISPTVAAGGAAVALMLLAISFGRDVRWLVRRRSLPLPPPDPIAGARNKP